MIPKAAALHNFTAFTLQLQPCSRKGFDISMKSNLSKASSRTGAGREKESRLIINLLLTFLLLAAMLFATGCGALLEELFAEDDGEGLTILAVYEIRDDRIYPHDFPEVDDFYLEWQEDSAKHETIWEMVDALIPADYMGLIAYLEIVTDGMDETMGAIEGVDDAEEDLYTLSLDIIDLYGDGDEIVMQIMVETLLHELGHLITLNETQVDPVDYEDSNPHTFYTDYGDCKEDSYLNLFFQRFWVDIYDQWSRAAEIEDDAQREKELEHFYRKHEDKFVSDYAATDPDEDIAETMMMFFLADKPPGRDMAEEKILFLYEFPELVGMREGIRAVLMDYDYSL